MDKSTIVILIMGAVLGFALSQWHLWRQRAIQQLGQTNACKGQMIRLQEMSNNLDDERKVQHDAMNGAFDYLNDNGPFGTNDIGLMQVRNVLLHAIQNSTYGRGK